MTFLSTMARSATKLGLHVERASPMTMWNLRLPKMMEHHSVATVLDIGANDGGYASSLLDGGFTGSVLSFEPLPDAWMNLTNRARTSSRWNVAPRMALSDTAGEASFYRAANSSSSSLLEMAEAHLRAAPNSHTLERIYVKTSRLDDIIDGLKVQAPFFIKIDVQGAEMMVLEGAIETLRANTVGIQVETSLQELYEKQSSKSEMEAFITKLGFEIWEIVPGFRDPNNFRLLQYDGIYFKA